MLRRTNCDAKSGSVFGSPFSTALAGRRIQGLRPPERLIRRLVFERIAAEPEIVTPTGIAVDSHGRVLVIESHTHFRPPDYPGPPADRIRVFEDRDHDGKPECTGTFFEGTQMTMNLAVARDDSVFVATRSALFIACGTATAMARPTASNWRSLPAPFVRLDTPGDYPHNGLSGFAFDFAGNVYFGLGENLGADYRLIGSDGATLSGGGEGGNIYRCRPDGSKLERVATGFWNPFHMTFDVFGRLFAVDNDPDSRPPCRLLHIVQRAATMAIASATAAKGCTLSPPGTASCQERWGWSPARARRRAASSSTTAINLPEDYRGSLLVTSWGDHRIEQYRLEPPGRSFQATMKPVVAGGEDFRPVGIAIAPDGSLYISDWVDKSYTLHGKGRIWRLRYAAVAADRASLKQRDATSLEIAPRSVARALTTAALSERCANDLSLRRFRTGLPTSARWPWTSCRTRRVN